MRHVWNPWRVEVKCQSDGFVSEWRVGVPDYGGFREWPMCRSEVWSEKCVEVRNCFEGRRKRWESLSQPKCGQTFKLTTAQKQSVPTATLQAIRKNPKNTNNSREKYFSNLSPRSYAFSYFSSFYAAAVVLGVIWARVWIGETTAPQLMEELSAE